MTGMILEDLDSTCVGKETYFRASYCAQLERMLEREEGAYCVWVWGLVVVVMVVEGGGGGSWDVSFVPPFF
jgi:hypothetical protein